MGFFSLSEVEKKVAEQLSKEKPGTRKMLPGGSFTVDPVSVRKSAAFRKIIEHYKIVKKV